MKICDVAQFYSPLGGGVKRYLKEKARHVGRGARGPDGRPAEHVLIRPAERDRVLREGPTTVYEVASPRLPGSASYRMLLARRRILEIVAAERPDLLEVDGPYRAAWITLEAGRRQDVPVVGFYHSDFPRSLGRTLERFLGRAARKLCDPLTTRYVVSLYNRMAMTAAPSPRVRRVLAECGVERSRTVPLGVDTDRFRPRPAAAAELRRDLGLSEGDVLLLYAGRLAREKNVAALVETAARLRERPDGERYHLLLVGDGEQRRLAEGAARRPGVAWLPYRESAAELAACYTAADLLLHAGLYETFGLVSIEAQACGARVLAVRGGGLESTLDGELRPVLAEAPTPEALAPAVLAALAAEIPDSRADRRRRIVERFHVTTTFDRLFALYAEVLESARAGRPIPDHADDAEIPRPARPSLSYR